MRLSRPAIDNAKRVSRVLLFFSIVWLLAGLSPALADKRVALVIGNGAYANAKVLDNPANDAEALAKALKGAGFASVIVERNLGRDALLEAMRRFESVADDADWALVYYAGHGMEVGGTNYLLPVDVKLRSDRDIDEEAVSLPQVQKRLEGARKLRIVILDACRNNPFAASMKRSVANRSVVERGLARPATRQSSLVAFAADAGEVAADAVADGGNSPYATALVRNLLEPDVEVNLFFRRVREDVLNATGQKQSPATYEALPSERLVFRPALATPPVVASAPSPALDEIAWRYLNRESIAALKQFLSDYPASAHAVEAKTLVTAATTTSSPARNELQAPTFSAAVKVKIIPIRPDGTPMSSPTTSGGPPAAPPGPVAIASRPPALSDPSNSGGQPHATPPVTNDIARDGVSGALCRNALRSDNMSWSMETRFASDVRMAKTRYGLDGCRAALGLLPLPSSATKEASRANVPLCGSALTFDKTDWDTTASSKADVARARSLYSVNECRLALGLAPFGKPSSAIASEANTFSVHLAAPGTRAEANDVADRLMAKYSVALGNTRLQVQKAEDKEVYRVRTSSLSRDGAVSMCERIKAAGGACFVAKR